jgi:hypothetical protein
MPRFNVTRETGAVFPPQSARTLPAGVEGQDWRRRCAKVGYVVDEFVELGPCTSARSVFLPARNNISTRYPDRGGWTFRANTTRRKYRVQVRDR